MPSKKDLIDIYNRYYAKNPEKWIDDNRNEFARKAIEKHLGREPKTVLDVGCGNGHTIKYLAKHWTDSRFTGLDISPVAISAATIYGDNFEYVCDFIGEIKLPKFYCTIVMGVAEHFEDLQAGLAAVLETVRKDGICYMEIPNCIGYPESRKEEGFRQTNFGSRQHEWHLFRETWDKELEKAGFKIAKRLDGINIFSEFCYILEVGE